MTQYDFTADLIVPPADPGEWPAWRAALRAWRTTERARLRLDRVGAFGGEHDRVARWFTSHKIFLWDQRIIAADGGGYTLEPYLDAFRERFGPLHHAILWHAYPNLGFDDRNQADFYRRLPGGLAGLRGLVDGLHARGIAAFLDYNPWDTGTRREAEPDHDTMAGLLRETGADGLYLDTLAGAAPDFRAASDAVRPGIILQAQSFVAPGELRSHQMGWAEDFVAGAIPGVLRNRWLERRHQQQVVHRWAADHTGELHTAWMNGAGIVVWENVFGTWNPWSDRDAALARWLGTMQERYADFFADGDWSPLVATAASGIYASCWQLGDERLYTLVNTRDEAHEGDLLPLEVAPGQAVLDITTGRPVAVAGGLARGRIDGRGLAGLLVTTRSPAGVPLAPPPVRGADRAAVAVRPPPAVAPAPGAAPGMVAVPGGRYERTYRYRNRECGFYTNEPLAVIDGNWPPDLHAPREGVEVVELAPFAIDARPVSNADYDAFLEASGYRPRYSEHFLAHHSRLGPDAPVVSVDIEDARAYAAWRGKRLPTEAEWQRAAEAGVVAYGEPRCWEWTESERSDGRTRFCILKGGSDWRAGGSYWYADGGPQEPAFGAKYLLQWPGQDRAATIGFRCVLPLR